ncbi:hypothetical protein KP509_37G062200 [Ceratopteris richardii]|uniref:3-hydroxy-3-methylglutaryl coenzyme A reductase n=1 Tax=Ceratopteris richardii TaxID=49495 RepID=A0A8T2Q9M8_CERRI|nr:hypothetical protein KP509_37G062200 [Ceratopteris richardii]KAH7280335.1 hypothetical protein KP509_37G062200 [Ceratopteris richardii]
MGVQEQEQVLCAKVSKSYTPDMVGPEMIARAPFKTDNSSNNKDAKVLASDALPLPVWLTNRVFVVLFCAATYYLMRRWGEKKGQTHLRILSFGDIIALVVVVSSFIYLLGFFGIDFVQQAIRSADGQWDFNEEAEVLIKECNVINPGHTTTEVPEIPEAVKQPKVMDTHDNSTDEEMAYAVSTGAVASYSLESSLGDAKRAAAIRKRAVELTTGRSLEGLPIEGFDYSAVLGQCCEMVIGHLQIPVGVAGPLLLDDFEYLVPMATTEGCLVASTNRGCKAIHMSGGATSVLLRDGMTRAPVLRFVSAQRAAELKFFIEDSTNFQTICTVFNRSSRFARLQSIQCALAGHNIYLRFSCFTGDAMGMNMVSKGVQNVLEHLQELFPDMEVISLSGNFCADKKATGVNWVNGRGKSVVCDAVIKGEVVAKVLKTSVSALVELNTIKNLTGSAIAGALGGFNAHASNIVSAVFLATGQDPAQNVESSSCITLMEPANNGEDLYISVTMPSIEVGTVGGGTQLASQSACLNLLGVKGASAKVPGSNAQRLARIVAGAVMAGELSLMSALAAGHLVQSHMKYNRSTKNLNANSVVETPKNKCM